MAYTKHLMPFSSFSDDLLQVLTPPDKKVDNFERTKHVQFWYWAQFPLTSVHITFIQMLLLYIELFDFLHRIIMIMNVHSYLKCK